jgi:hypothetical protein
MNEKEPQRLTLENCEIVYRYEDGKVTLFSYSGQPKDVIRELMEKYLLPRERYLEHPYHPDALWWGTDAS